MKYSYCNKTPEPYDTVEANFRFIDVDGNEVEGSYANSNVLQLMEMLGDVITEEFHPTVNEPSLWMNGIIDISKPIVITIVPVRASK